MNNKYLPALEFKKEDMMMLDNKNIKIARLNKSLNYKNLKLFKIIKAINNIIYKLKFLDDINIFSIFHL